MKQRDELFKRFIRAYNMCMDEDLNSAGQKQRRFSFHEAQAVRDDYMTGCFTQQQLADKYECTQANISLIVNHNTHPVAPKRKRRTVTR